MTIESLALPNASAVNYSDGDVNYIIVDDAVHADNANRPIKNMAHRDNLLASKLNEVIEGVNSGPQAHTLESHSNTSGFSNENPLMNGAVSQGTSDRLSRQDHVHPVDTSREPAITKNTAFNKNFGTAEETVCQGNDARLLAGKFKHTQSAAATTWTVNHNLGSEDVIVQVYNASNKLFVPDEVEITSANQVVITCSPEVAGKAIILAL